VLKLRGMERDELVGLVGGFEPRASADVAEEEPQPEPAPAEPLPTDPPTFWHPGSLPDDLFGGVRVPAVNAALAKRLGSFPFWRATEGFLEAMEPLYAHASPAGLETFLADAAE
jgi:uncharacterized Zn finger protein